MHHLKGEADMNTIPGIEAMIKLEKGTDLTEKKRKKKQTAKKNDKKIEILLKKLSINRQNINSLNEKSAEKAKRIDSIIKEKIKELADHIINKAERYCFSKVSSSCIGIMGADGIKACVLVGFAEALDIYDVYNLDRSSFSSFVCMHAYGELVDEIRRSSTTPASIYERNSTAEGFINMAVVSSRYGLSEEDKLQAAGTDGTFTISNRTDAGIENDNIRGMLTREMFDSTPAETRELNLKNIISSKITREVIHYYYIMGIDNIENLSQILEKPKSTIYRLKREGEQAIERHFGSKALMKRFIYG